VAVWADRSEPYARGEAARVHLRVIEPSHVAVFRVDTEGRVSVLFPYEPWGDAYLRHVGERVLTGPRGEQSFEVDDAPGVGYLFALASPDPLDLRAISRGDAWDYRLIAGWRLRGDPYAALTDLAARLSPTGRYDYDIVPYYVEADSRTVERADGCSPVGTSADRAGCPSVRPSASPPVRPLGEPELRRRSP
jgi:hypothetical protein